MLRDLLVHVDSSESGRRRVRFAVGLAARTGARLSGIHVAPSAEVPPLYKPSQVDEIAGQLTSRLARETSAAAAIFSTEASQCADASWFEAQGDVVAGICHKAKFTDMVIVGQDERQGAVERHPFPIAHAVAVRCGRPVLVVPAEVQGTSLARVALAWDGSRESVRALHDALPLLRLSQSLDIVTVFARDADRDANEIQSLQQHLTRHGIESIACALRPLGTDEHEVLRRHLEQGLHDLVVMGAYSHPMWMEFVFGGASESILMSSKVPVLVSH